MSPCVPVMVAQGCLHSSGIHFVSDETEGKETLSTKCQGVIAKTTWYSLHVVEPNFCNSCVDSLFHSKDCFKKRMEGKLVITLIKTI